MKDLKTIYAELERLQKEVDKMMSNPPSNPPRQQFVSRPLSIHERKTELTLPAVVKRPAIAGVIIMFGDNGIPAAVRTYDRSGYEIEDLTGSYRIVREDILKLML